MQVVEVHVLQDDDGVLARVHAEQGLRREEKGEISEELLLTNFKGRCRSCLARNIMGCPEEWPIMAPS